MLKNFFLLCLFILLYSCLKDNNIELSDELNSHSNDKIELSDELKTYLKEIGKICIYSMDRSLYYIDMHQSFEKNSLYSEGHIRRNGNILIFNRNNGQQTDLIALLLYSARRINVDPKENVVQTIRSRDILWSRTSGCVIDIYDISNNIIKTYIMQNGLDVFFEKGKEGIYYEMPNILLDKYIIKKDEFLQVYRENIRDEINRSEESTSVYIDFGEKGHKQ